MFQKLSRKSLQIAIVDPSQADANWLKLVAEEIDPRTELTDYRTGIAALQAWKRQQPLALDLIVVADILPMLSLKEFLDQAMTTCPGVPFVIAAEPISSIPHAVNLPVYLKPLSTDEVQDMILSALRRRGAIHVLAA